MNNFLQNIWQGFRGTVRGFDSTRQLAAGIVLGMMIGLIPKDSLLVYVIALVALISTANLLCVILSGLMFTWIGKMLDPITDAVGTGVLSIEALQPVYAFLIQLPIVPWTRFENSVVTGSAVIGLLIAYPLYFISKSILNRLEPAFGSNLFQSHFVRWILGSPIEPTVDSLNGAEN